jgi:hypothetical protein
VVGVFYRGVSPRWKIPHLQKQHSTLQSRLIHITNSRDAAVLVENNHFQHGHNHMLSQHKTPKPWHPPQHRLHKHATTNLYPAIIHVSTTTSRVHLAAAFPWIPIVNPPFATRRSALLIELK